LAQSIFEPKKRNNHEWLNTTKLASLMELNKDESRIVGTSCPSGVIQHYKNYLQIKQTCFIPKRLRNYNITIYFKLYQNYYSWLIDSCMTIWGLKYKYEKSKIYF